MAKQATDYNIDFIHFWYCCFWGSRACVKTWGEPRPKQSPRSGRLKIVQHFSAGSERVIQVNGCVIEFGVWRGGMIAGVAAILGPSRDYFLFDSFEGLPPAKEIDRKAALDWQQNTTSPIYHDKCSARPEFAEQAMRSAAAKSFHLRKGWFAQTLAEFKLPAPIALLRLDADWYDSTMICLESLFDHVAPYTWDGCSRALHDFLSSRAATERIMAVGNVCYLVKIAGALLDNQ